MSWVDRSPVTCNFKRYLRVLRYRLKLQGFDPKNHPPFPSKNHPPPLPQRGEGDEGGGHCGADPIATVQILSLRTFGDFDTQPELRCNSYWFAHSVPRRETELRCKSYWGGFNHYYFGLYRGQVLRYRPRRSGCSTGKIHGMTYSSPVLATIG